MQRQIVVKAFGTQLDIEDLVRIKYASTSFHSIAWIFIFVNVTIYKTVLIQMYQDNSNHIIITKLRRCVEN
jgi:hypothetical protein